MVNLKRESDHSLMIDAILTCWSDGGELGKSQTGQLMLRLEFGTGTSPIEARNGECVLAVSGMQCGALLACLCYMLSVQSWKQV
jgi:hypothetical protein